MNLDDALTDFDAVETTLSRLESVWAHMSALIPEGIAYDAASAEAIEYENLSRAFHDLARGLPLIDGWTVTEQPLALDEIAQDRFDASEIGEIDAIASVERAAGRPGEEIREYRFRFSRARRSLIRTRVGHLLKDVDAQLAALAKRIARNNEPILDSDWPLLAESIREVERLMGSSLQRRGRWMEIRRHLSFGQGCDLHDIADHDWPSVRRDIESALYGAFEPVPVGVPDLAEIAATQPVGKVSTELAWSVLTNEGFERLVFNLIRSAPGYENARWLTHTSAPDHGRDLSVERVVTDSLGGVMRTRVIIQCKHWLSRSIAPSDVAGALAAVKLCEPPPVDVLIIATSGRFSADAVTWIEKHNHERSRPSVEPWPESHLESALAERAPLVAEFGLRPRT